MGLRKCARLVAKPRVAATGSRYRTALFAVGHTAMVVAATGTVVVVVVAAVELLVLVLVVEVELVDDVGGEGLLSLPHATAKTVRTMAKGANRRIGD
ncbi:MAG TPA: hypothetical protein VNC41_16805 [Acidimicrobiia bacterium]|nr:hypothetical protein [Acidimicrobiia bacterium]